MRPHLSLVTGCCHVRCRHCERRRTLARPLHLYSAERLPQCCGRRDWRPDKYRQRREVGEGAPRPCRCPQYHFPHYKGRGMCIHNPNVTEEYAAARGRA